MDLQELMTKKVSEILDTKLEALVTSKAEKCVDDILNDLFKSWGELSKQLQEQMKTGLKIDLSNVKLESYSDRVSRIVHHSLDKILDDKSIMLVQENLRSSLSYLTKQQWKLSEIVTEFVKEFDWEDKDYIEPTILVEHSSYGSVYICLDEQSDKEYYNCRYRFTLDKNTGRVWNYEIQGKYRTNYKERGLLSPFENLVFALYANQATVEVDDFETEFYRNED